MAKLVRCLAVQPSQWCFSSTAEPEVLSRSHIDLRQLSLEDPALFHTVLASGIKFKLIDSFLTQPSPDRVPIRTPKLLLEIIDGDCRDIGVVVQVLPHGMLRVQGRQPEYILQPICKSLEDSKHQSLALKFNPSSASYFISPQAMDNPLCFRVDGSYSLLPHQTVSICESLVTVTVLNSL